MTKKEMDMIADTIRTASIQPTEREQLTRDFLYTLSNAFATFDRARFARIALYTGEVASTDAAVARVL